MTCGDNYSFECSCSCCSRHLFLSALRRRITDHHCPCITLPYSLLKYHHPYAYTCIHPVDCACIIDHQSLVVCTASQQGVATTTGDDDSLPSRVVLPWVSLHHMRSVEEEEIRIERPSSSLGTDTAGTERPGQRDSGSVRPRLCLTGRR